MTYLVTGGNGFIGSHVVRNLIKEGKRVIVYDLNPSPAPLQRLISAEELEKQVKIVHGDVTDYALLLKTLKENEVEKIIHLAAVMILEFNANPLLGVKTNLEGTAAVFEAARFLNIKKVVWASSGSVFGPEMMYKEEYIPNDAPQYPQNLYGAAKSFDEILANHYTARYGLDITALRFVMVYGAGQTNGRTAAIMKQMVYNPALGKPGRVPAAADNVLGWTYVDDAARAVVMAAKASNLKTKAFSVMGKIHTVKEVADAVLNLLPKAKIDLMPLEKSASHTIMTCKYDTSRIEEELGFYPEWDMERGIKATINNVRQENGLSEMV
ncbi:MAG: NAD(P)-dependent oxidoreductase [Dehalococcoidales bacterium]|nr:NAD(P)-dependent oxidoreductase [Dehalococcoidales bacterium]